MNWSTGLEEDNAGFDIERRSESEQDFTTIGWVDAANNVQDENHYTFIDDKAQVGLTYHYRLRQVDYDGQEDYSIIKSARIQSNETVVNLYPNPASDDLGLSIVGDYEHIEASLFDAAGRLIERLNWNNSIDELSIDVSSLPIGIYGIYLQIDSQKIMKRFVVER